MGASHGSRVTLPCDAPIFCAQQVSFRMEKTDMGSHMMQSKHPLKVHCADCEPDRFQLYEPLQVVTE